MVEPLEVENAPVQAALTTPWACKSWIGYPKIGFNKENNGESMFMLEGYTSLLDKSSWLECSPGNQ